jgi:hypothetical protein
MSPTGASRTCFASTTEPQLLPFKAPGTIQRPCRFLGFRGQSFATGAILLLMQRQSHIPVVEEKACSACGKLYKPLRRGMCQPCYRRNARYGTTEYRRMELDDVTVDFVLSNCTESGECLLWEGTVSKEGRPQTMDRRLWREEGKTRQILLHRWMYEQHSGDELRKGQQVRQTCGEKRCLAPVHLETSTPRPGREPLGDAGQ